MFAPCLNIRLDPPLARAFLDADFDGILADGRIALGDDYPVAPDFGSLLGERVDRLPIVESQKTASIA